MRIDMFVVGIIVWSIFGFALAKNLIGSEGFEYVNPIWIYKTFRVNYFGAAVCCILFNLLSPIGSICYWFYKLFGSICYWFYKLCTVGRKH